MAVRPRNFRPILARNRDNPINRHPPTRFPYLEEIMNNPMVQQAIDRAWTETNADIIPITAACEQGGWIYMNLRTGGLTIIRKENHLGPARRPGENQQGFAEIDLNNPVIVPGSIVVANFHTHPSVPFVGASYNDTELGRLYGVPCIIRGRGQQYDFTGPERRAGEFRYAGRYPGYAP